MSLSQTLIIPVDVRAFCIGDGDLFTVTDQDFFTGATLDFSQITPAKSKKGAAIVGRENVVFRDHHVPPLTPLARGIHLHWNLPRAFTHGQAQGDAGDISFPVVPNRWLVTRIVADRTSYTRSWVVESDHIAPDVPDGAASPTIFIGYDHDQPYRYLGRVVRVQAAGWTEPEPGPGPSTLRSLTQSDLTAMQTGDPLFASFYPNCRNVFGMHDDLDLAELEGATILYVVAGWYGNPANDPLHQGLGPKALLDQFGWSLPDGTDRSFNRSLCVGQVQGIRWRVKDTYVPADKPVEVTLGLGSNGPQALSALIGGAVNDPDQSKRKTLEEMLSAYQIGAAFGALRAAPRPARRDARPAACIELQPRSRRHGVDRGAGRQSEGEHPPRRSARRSGRQAVQAERGPGEL